MSSPPPVLRSLLVGLAAGAVLAVLAPSAALALGAVLVGAVVPATVVDLRERRIPNAVTLPAAVAALVAGLALDGDGTPARVAWAAAAAGFLLVPALARPDGMGLGDVKLAGVLGLCLGPAVAVAVLAALVAATAWGAGLALRRGVGAARRTTLPFGPYLAAGGLVALAAGGPLVDAYVGAL
ncbi:A24 family peptidase [Patulibacter sp. SYSU D01012]|uniref:prepilin peptidase n=1 Tax=Patulibacter sp. SYSU D01012 TaxID=2817381 RepID=UPI001B312A7C